MRTNCKPSDRYTGLPRCQRNYSQDNGPVQESCVSGGNSRATYTPRYRCCERYRLTAGSGVQRTADVDECSPSVQQNCEIEGIRIDGDDVRRAVAVDVTYDDSQGVFSSIKVHRGLKRSVAVSLQNADVVMIPAIGNCQVGVPISVKIENSHAERLLRHRNIHRNLKGAIAVPEQDGNRSTLAISNCQIQFPVF